MCSIRANLRPAQRSSAGPLPLKKGSLVQSQLHVICAESLGSQRRRSRVWIVPLSQRGMSPGDRDSDGLAAVPWMNAHTVGATFSESPLRLASLAHPPTLLGKGSRCSQSRAHPCRHRSLLFPHRWGRSGIGGGAAIQFKAQGPVPRVGANRPPGQRRRQDANLFPQISILLLKTPS